MNLGFSSYRLPPAAKLWLVSEDPLMPNYYQGPYTSRDNATHGRFWTPLLPGDSVVVEVVVPAGIFGDLELSLGSVGRGFQDAFGSREGEGLQAEGGLQACNIDGATVVTYFNYQSPGCGQLGGGSLNQSVSGATVRSQTSAETVDALLMELSSKPPAGFQAYYAGWDRSGAVPAGPTIGIHHPDGLEKMFSQNDDPLESTANCTSDNQDITHWDLNWEKGTTQPGSSGSALFDAQTGRVVGFLTGGGSSCAEQAEYDCYGKLSVAWSGQPNNQNIGPWLDPQNTGILSVNGADPNEAGSGGVALTGVSSGTYVVDGLSDQGFFLTIGANPNGSRFLFFAWFTFDQDGYPLWLVGVQNPLASNSNTADVSVQALFGPQFMDFSGQTAERTNFGTMRFEQLNCTDISVNYDFGSNGTGSMTLNKLTGIDGLTCNG